MDTGEIEGIINRVPIFRGLNHEQTDRVLSACHIVHVEDGEVLFSEGAESNSMLIVILGQLEVRSYSGSVIASITQNGVVGEMGILTNQPRSATVVADGGCTLLAIGRKDLFDIIEDDKDIGFQIYRNVTQILIERLRDSNVLLEQQYLLLEDIAGGGPDSR